MSKKNIFTCDLCHKKTNDIIYSSAYGGCSVCALCRNVEDFGC
jgi:hypothetical protein